MLILAIDSATPVAGVALMKDDRLIKEEFSNYQKTHSETLMPMVDRVLNESECTVKQVDVFAVTIGPGSFTGLRIGLATVKGLSMAVGRPVVGVSTLDTLAHNICASEALVCPLLDARKQEIYCGFYNVAGKLPLPLLEPMACSPEKFLEYALKVAMTYAKNRIILLGDGYYPYTELFAAKLGPRLVIPPPHLMHPRASALAVLGADKFAKGFVEDIIQLRPSYIRLSEAESRLRRGEL